ncbi:hypothetical protein ASG01_00015, partial [Chryseobacterium sp. Leaf180]|uniref:alpha-ketoglutarate-dependent dioxygenase AlkB family protein n=1 Tax=Chryseobacterium sp. Leaf180 TaxID=1736289 RepID=UPI0006F2FAAF
MGQLSLFSAEEFYNFPEDLLEFREHFLSSEESRVIFNDLLASTPWKQSTQSMYDRKVLTPRLTEWYGDKATSNRLGGKECEVNDWTPELLALKNRIENVFGLKFNSVLLNLYRDNNDSVAWRDKATSNRLGGKECEVNDWTPELLALKNRIENVIGLKFNFVLLNLYRDNNDSVAWHTDKDSRFGDRPVIASLSMGQTRKFDFRKKDHHQSRYSIPLPEGSLLLMKGNLQEYWEHRIAKSSLPMKERIN